MNRYVLIFLLFCLTAVSIPSFKTEQQKYQRVRKAYQEKEAVILEKLNSKGIDPGKLQIYIRAFKQDKLVELWGRNGRDGQFVLIEKYDICHLSGEPGPKRKQGDLQIPEGFYHIDRFNPWSNYYLSLGINYPNRSDRILGYKPKLGGDIFIHGACVTIGCIPVTDENIKEIYIYCVEAKNNGQENIPVTIFPVRLTDQNFNTLKAKYGGREDMINLWTDLKTAYNMFNSNYTLPNITFLSTGRHQVN